MRGQLERAIKEKTELNKTPATSWQEAKMWQFVMEVLYVAGAFPSISTRLLYFRIGDFSRELICPMVVFLLRGTQGLAPSSATTLK